MSCSEGAAVQGAGWDPGPAAPASSLLALLWVLPQAVLHVPVQSLEILLSF